MDGPSAISHHRSPDNLKYMTVGGAWSEQHAQVISQCMDVCKTMVSPFHEIWIAFEWDNSGGIVGNSDFLAVSSTNKQDLVVDNGVLLHPLELKVLKARIPLNVMRNESADVVVHLKRDFDFHVSVTEPVPSTHIDLVHVIMHELLHCLWHSNPFYFIFPTPFSDGKDRAISRTTFSGVQPDHLSRWHQFLALHVPEQGDTKRFIPFSNLVHDPVATHFAITSGKLTFVSEKKGPLFYVYSPSTYAEGSSFVHPSPNSANADLSLFFPVAMQGVSFRDYTPALRMINDTFWDLDDRGAAHYEDCGENIMKFPIIEGSPRVVPSSTGTPLQRLVDFMSSLEIN